MTNQPKPFSEKLRAIGLTMGAMNLVPTPENVLTWAEEFATLERSNMAGLRLAEQVGELAGQLAATRKAGTLTAGILRRLREDDRVPTSLIEDADEALHEWRRVAGEAEMTKIERDTGGGCSVCGATPAVNVRDTYWLCGPCILGIVEKNAAMRESEEWRQIGKRQIAVMRDAIDFLIMASRDKDGVIIVDRAAYSRLKMLSTSGLRKAGG